MADTKKFSDWEREKGWLVKDADADELKTKLTEDEFIKRAQAVEGVAHGVNFEDRELFLSTNGYAITRENLMADLPNTTTAEPDIAGQLLEELQTMKAEPDEAE